MSNLVDHAKHELVLAGYLDGDHMNKMMYDNIIELIQVFAKQGHSGFSAPFCVNLFRMLALYEPLCPLQGTPDEWINVGADSNNELFLQNKRRSSVFWTSKGVYDIDGYVFEDDDGRRFTNVLSRKYIHKWPYMPSKPEVIKTSSMTYWWMQREYERKQK